MQVRAEFEANRSVLQNPSLGGNTDNIWCRNVHDPRALAIILEKAEATLAGKLHPDPYIGIFALLVWMCQKLTLFFRPRNARGNQMVSTHLSFPP